MNKNFLRSVLSLLILSIGMTDSLVAKEKSKKDRTIEFTYQGSPNDTLYRVLSEALLTFQKVEQVPEAAECGYEIVGEAASKKYRKKYDLPKEQELTFFACHFANKKFCEMSFWNNRTKCYSGDVSIYPDKFKMSKDGNSVKAEGLFVFFDEGGRTDGKVDNIFRYEYSGTKSESGWTFDKVKFKNMVDI